MKFWDNPIQVTYRVAAADLTGGAAVLSRIQGPPGARGRVQFLQTAVTVAVTGSNAAVLLGTNSDTDQFLSFSVAIAAAGELSTSQQTDVKSIALPADTVLELGTDGAATEGEADILLSIAWERK